MVNELVRPRFSLVSLRGRCWVRWCFLIYINDIAANLDNSTCIRLFADDCLLYRVIKSPHDHEVLQKDLTSLYEWSCKWQMSFNISKCKTLWITTKRNPSVFNHSKGNEYLDHVSHHPYLGVEITHITYKWCICQSKQGFYGSYVESPPLFKDHQRTNVHCSCSPPLGICQH